MNVHKRKNTTTLSLSRVNFIVGSISKRTSETSQASVFYINLSSLFHFQENKCINNFIESWNLKIFAAKTKTLGLGSTSCCCESDFEFAFLHINVQLTYDVALFGLFPTNMARKFPIYHHGRPLFDVVHSILFIFCLQTATPIT